MDRTKLKETGSRSRANRDVTNCEPAQETKVSDVFLPPASITLRNTRLRETRTFELTPLNVNDLIEVEKRFGGLNQMLERLQTFNPEYVRDFFWLMLSRCSPELTVAEAGEWMPVKNGDILSALDILYPASGLIEKKVTDEEETETATE